MTAYKKILIPLNVDSEIQPALAAASALALPFRSSLELIHVFETPGYRGPDVIEIVDGVPTRPEEEYAPWRTAKAMLHHVSSLQGEGLQARGRFLQGVVEESIIEEVRREGIDLVVIGIRSRGGLERMLGGNLVTHLINACPCPMLVIPHE